MAIEFKTELMRLNSNVWDTALFVPREKVEDILDKSNTRVICTINGAHSFHGALMSVGDGNFFINTNKEIRKKSNIELGDQVLIKIEKDNSIYGMPLPEELTAAWEIDPDGHAVFHTLTMGKQRSLIHVIGKPKSSEIRIKKALVVLEYLKRVNGKLDFKELNEAFKNANN